MRFICLVIFIMYLYSCSGTKDKISSDTINSLQFVDSAVFEVGFFFMPTFSAEYFDLESQQDLLFFADPKTHKQLKFFHRDGSLHTTVDLKNAVVSLPEPVLDIEVISLDSIVLFTSNGNLVAINRKGEVWKQFNIIQKLGLHLDEEKSYKILSSVMHSRGMIDRKDIILYLSTSLKKKFEEHSDWIIANKANKWNSEQFIRIIDLVSDTPNYQLGGKLLRAISPKDSNIMVIDIFNTYNVYDNLVYITHMFSDKLFIMDANNMEIVKSKIIQSDYTTFGAPLYFSKNKIENKEAYSKASKGIKEKGKLSGIFYNESKKHYYITGGFDKDTQYFGKWLLMIYDQEFNKLKEYIFDPKEWLGRIFPTENGFTLQKRITTQDIADQKMVLYEFTY